LVAYGYAGLFSRYAADDYCTAGQLASRGLLGMQVSFYQGWSGRVTFTLAAGLVESVGISLVPALSALVVAVWTGVLTWSIAPAAAALRWPRPLPTSLLLALMLVTVTLGTTADLGQSLFWQTGMLTYLLPLVALAGYAGVIQRQVARTDSGPTGPGAIAASVLLAFDAGGSSETYVAMQTGTLGLAVALCLVFGRGRRRLLVCLLAGLVASAAALVVVAVAPGDTVRESGHPTPDLRFALTSGAVEVRDFVRGFWRFSPVPALLAAVLPGVIGLVAPGAGSMVGVRRHDSRRAARALAVVVCGTLVALALCFVPSYYALSSPAPGRARVIPQFVLVAATATAGTSSAGTCATVCARRTERRRWSLVPPSPRRSWESSLYSWSRPRSPRSPMPGSTPPNGTASTPRSGRRGRGG